MFFLKGNSKRHYFDRFHNKVGALLPARKYPTMPIYKNYKEFIRSPFAVVAISCEPVKDIIDTEDAMDLSASLFKHTKGYKDAFIPEEKIQTAADTKHSDPPSLLGPRRKYNSSQCSGELRLRRKNLER